MDSIEHTSDTYKGSHDIIISSRLTRITKADRPGLFGAAVQFAYVLQPRYHSMISRTLPVESTQVWNLCATDGQFNKSLGIAFQLVSRRTDSITREFTSCLNMNTS